MSIGLLLFLICRACPLLLLSAPTSGTNLTLGGQVAIESIVMLCGLSLIIKGSRAKFKVFEGLGLAANVGRGMLRTYGFYVRAVVK